MASTQIELLKKYGLEIRGFKGQHLLVDPNVRRKIIETLSLVPGDRVLEIGPGLGALTSQILAAGATVVAVEKDKRFSEILQGELGGDYPGRLWIENEDILKVDSKKLSSRFKRLSPVRQEDRGGGGRPRKFKVVSNLPYYITSPILFWLIAHRTLIERAVLMMQKEVANRLLAQPGQRDYSRLTLAVRFYAEVRRHFDVSRNCFTPKPEVDSSVVELDFHPPSKLPKGVEEDFVFHLIQAAFGARRKTLLNRLVHDRQIGKNREELLKILKKTGIPENARGETLMLKDFIALAEQLTVG